MNILEIKKEIKRLLDNRQYITEIQFTKFITILNTHLWNLKIEDFKKETGNNYIYYKHMPLCCAYYKEKLDKTIALRRLEREMEKYNYEWGILLNNEGIFVLNNDIKTLESNTKLRKLVFTFSFSGKTDWDYFELLSCKNIFGIHKNLYFFRDMITYKNLKFRGEEKSWQAYHSAMKRFFFFYINKMDEWIDDGRNNYDSIQLEHFIEYMNHSPGIKAHNTRKTQFFYVKDFILFMAEKNSSFDNGSYEVIRNYLDESHAVETKLTETDVQKLKKIINYLGNKKTAKYKVIFLLLLSFGMERRRLCTLEWNDFSKDLKVFYFKKGKKDKYIIVPKVLKESLQELRQEIPADAEYILGNVHSKYKKPISEHRINEMMSGIQTIDSNDAFYEKMYPSNIRKWLFVELLRQGYPLQDVLMMMNISVNNLKNFIGDEDLLQYASEKIEKECWIDTILNENK